MPADPKSRHSGPPPRQAAVAIKHAPGDTDELPQDGAFHLATAPTVVAKGHGAVAEQILALAFAAGVRVREDADLVEVLQAVEIDTEVPLHALAAVAEILSYVYRANNAAAGPAADTSDGGQAR